MRVSRADPHGIFGKENFPKLVDLNHLFSNSESSYFGLFLQLF